MSVCQSKTCYSVPGSCLLLVCKYWCLCRCKPDSDYSKEANWSREHCLFSWNNYHGSSFTKPGFKNQTAPEQTVTKSMLPFLEPSMNHIVVLSTATKPLIIAKILIYLRRFVFAVIKRSNTTREEGEATVQNRDPHFSQKLHRSADGENLRHTR